MVIRGAGEVVDGDVCGAGVLGREVGGGGDGATMIWSIPIRSPDLAHTALKVICINSLKKINISSTKHAYYIRNSWLKMFLIKI